MNDIKNIRIFYIVLFFVSLFFSVTFSSFFYLLSLFFVYGVFFPKKSVFFYSMWMKVSEFIGSVISKIIMFILYFGLFTIVSIVLKIFGKDLLRKKMDKNQSTYWINREMQPQSMKNQF